MKQIFQVLSARFTSFLAVLFISIAAGQIVGQTLTPAEEAVQTAVLQKEEAKSRLAISGWIDSGITFNPDSPHDNQNFGRLFDDRANEPLLNQAVINAERALDPKAGFDWGFKLQLMFGTDPRFIHSLGMRNHRAGIDSYQGDIPEAYLNLHFPIFTEGGLDLKLGKFVTLEGAETIDPRTNFFYSHTYIFNFGIPLNHTGALATWHATPHFNLVAGLTRGVNTSTDDNNDSLAFHGGIGLDLDESKLVISAATHIGPETPNDNHDQRYLNCVTTTWKVTDKLTSITDLNYAYDAGADAAAYGVAQYLTYAINSWLTAGVRGEVFRDDKGFFVVSFANNDDPIRLLAGEPTTDPRTVGGGATTYGAITIGLNIKPSMPKPISSLTIRPEIRFDRALNGTLPFNDSSERNQFTVGIDVIVVF